MTTGPRRPGRDRPAGARRPAARSAQAPSQRARRADPARDAAYTVLRAVHDGAYANLELPGVLRRERLDARDASLATELCYGTLRMQGLYDAVIAVAADRPVTRIDAPVLDVLRLGCHQVLGMRVPDHAAVSATVALARHRVGAGPAGLVNAVLRRVVERSREDWVEAVTAGVEDPVAALALEHSHPAWVVRALRGALLGHVGDRDEVGTELVQLLVAHNTPAELTLVARPGLVEDAELRAAGARPDPVAATAWTLPSGDPGALPAVREHRVAVQDAGSQLVALTLADVPVDGPERRWLDLCAGPGGKAGLLAALALRRGIALDANEVSPHRAALVEQALAPVVAAGGEVSVRVGDGRDLGEERPDSYDRVLVDAPCTGLGALRRRPEARWRRSPSDLATLGPLQRGLLAAALRTVRPGGVVAYATCSPHLAETELVVRDVLRGTTGVVLEDVRELVRDRRGEALPGTGPGPWAQLWPHRHGTDGMFLALLRRAPEPAR